MIGAAVIGLGVGMLHCEGYAKSRHAKLLAVCVKEREEKLGKARKRFGKVDTYKGYKEVLERDDIDVVSVVTPNYTHYQIAMEAIKAGKHVMLEKPMALTLEEAQSLVIAAEKNAVKLGVNFCCRYTPRFAEIKRLVDGGDAGRITSVAAYSWRSPSTPKSHGACKASVSEAWYWKCRFTFLTC